MESMEDQIKINKARLLQRLDELAQIGALDDGGDAPPFSGGVSRLALSDADKEARDLTVSWMEALELKVSIDYVGDDFPEKTHELGEPARTRCQPFHGLQPFAPIVTPCGIA